LPYDLPAVAVKDKPFREITPNSTDEADMLRLLLPAVTTWRNSAAISLALYAQSASNQDQDDHTARDVAALLLLIRWRSFFERLEAWHRGKWLASVKAATGVDATWMTARPVGAVAGYMPSLVGAEASGGLVAAARAAQQAGNTFTNAPSRAYPDPFNTITGNKSATATIDAAIDNAVVSARTLAKSISDEAQNRINQALNAGKRTGAAATDVARDINAGLVKVRARAVRGSENEIDNALKGFTDARIAEAGLTFAKWQHNTLINFRPDHKARQGNLYAVGDPIWNDQYAPFCRCQKVPVLKLGKFSGI